MIQKIAILGDFNPAHSTLHALNESTRSIQKNLNLDVQFDWIPTDIFNNKVVFETKKYTGLWIAPGSPYRDMENVLNAIKFTRENNIPTFGNCGGFQHMIIEFARNVCDIQHADHEENNPDGVDPLIKKLSCSLKGGQENLKLIDKNSFLYQTIHQDNIVGKYNCSYGINENYIDILAENGLSLTSISEDGNYRSFEIKSHLFFVGTLFQPALTSTENEPNPIIIEFVKKSLGLN